MRFGYAEYELAARFALATIELQSGQAAAGRDQLLQLEKDANAKGFQLLSRKARAALG
jgi:hypothetical protein